MTRDTAFWTMVGGLLIPVFILGGLRGRAVTRAYRAIHADLRAAGVELSKADLQELIARLNRNPKAVLETESNPERRAIKEQHVRPLLSFTKVYRWCFYVLLAVGVVALSSFSHLWPKR